MTNETDVKLNLSPVWTRIFSIEADHAQGSYLYDIHGDKYLDFTCGIGVTNTGHCHPRVVEAIQKQAGLLIHGQANIVIHKPMLELVEELKTIVNPTIDGFFFTNSGADAVEGAIKLARHATGRSNTLLSQTAPNETAAILIEPILGEGGYVVPPENFLPRLREICDEYGIMLIVDEIQSGFGRAGKWFAQEHFNTTPDIMQVAKGIASGLPLSGVFSKLELMKKWQTGTHGGTYGGNAIACAAGVATIKAMRDENMLENARIRGEQLINHLRRIQFDFPVIGDVRGLGLMMGVDLRTPERKPDKVTTKAVA